jgi:hypothetical protein
MSSLDIYSFTNAINDFLNNSGKIFLCWKYFRGRSETACKSANFGG